LDKGFQRVIHGRDARDTQPNNEPDICGSVANDRPIFSLMAMPVMSAFCIATAVMERERTAESPTGALV
jgi:hypothetical protein